MKITFKVLKELMEECYDLGAGSALEMREQIVEEVMSKVAKPEKIEIYSVEELQSFPIGSKFHHSILGKAEIVERRGVKLPFMKFENGVMYSFSQNGYPWTVPMLHLPE